MSGHSVMKRATTLLAVVACATAGSAPAGHEWRAPGPGDVRSPCPGINTLANHGFFPRNGKNITVAQAITALQEGMNVGADFATGVGLLALMSGPDLTATTFDFNNLDEHDFPIEHDGSLSREDYYFGNDHSFNQTIFNEVLAFYKGMDTATIPVASKASYGETVLYLSTMGNPITGDAPISYIKSLFEEERLPYELGWSKPKTETNLVTLGAMISQLQAANPQAVPEGLSLGEGTLRDALYLINPLTGKAQNETCLLDDTCDAL